MNSIVISSGHGKYVRGASGILDEVDEARLVVEKLAGMLRERGVDVVTYHDDVSTTQNENLQRITDFHNSKQRDLDISVHFNAYEQVEKPMRLTPMVNLPIQLRQWAISGDMCSGYRFQLAKKEGKLRDYYHRDYKDEEIPDHGAIRLVGGAGDVENAVIASI